MSKKLEKELFNIYDVIVFEDENGIAQDCVCFIGKDKEVDEIVDMIECNNHSISIYENGSYKVWEKDEKNKPYYATNKKIIHLYTLKNDNRFYEIYPTNDYEAIDNANPSEALKCLEKLKGMEISSMPFSDEYGTQEVDLNDIRKVGSQLNIDFREYTATIKQALLKAQEPKHYLKWEDLEFEEEEQSIQVLLNGKKYTMFYCSDEVCFDTVSIAGVFIDSCSQQFFNDLHLERVEE